jgi:hypothetical protein
VGSVIDGEGEGGGGGDGSVHGVFALKCDGVNLGRYGAAASSAAAGAGAASAASERDSEDREQRRGENGEELATASRGKGTAEKEGDEGGGRGCFV